MYLKEVSDARHSQPADLVQGDYDIKINAEKYKEITLTKTLKVRERERSEDGEAAASDLGDQRGGVVLQLRTSQLKVNAR